MTGKFHYTLSLVVKYNDNTSSMFGTTTFSQNVANPSGVNDGSYLLISVRVSLRVDGVNTVPKNKRTFLNLQVTIKKS